MESRIFRMGDERASIPNESNNFHSHLQAQHFNCTEIRCILQYFLVRRSPGPFKQSSFDIQTEPMRLIFKLHEGIVCSRKLKLSVAVGQIF